VVGAGGGGAVSTRSFEYFCSDWIAFSRLNLALKTPPNKTGQNELPMKKMRKLTVCTLYCTVKGLNRMVGCSDFVNLRENLID